MKLIKLQFPGFIWLKKENCSQDGPDHRDLCFPKSSL